MKSLIVVATDEEYQLAIKRFPRHKIIQTGVGGVNVVRRLMRIPRWRKLLNFGYAGSNTLPKGSEVFVKECRSYHPNVEYSEPVLRLKIPKNTQVQCVSCLTSSDFVLEYSGKLPVVFDMELAFILAMGFRHIQSLKIVSDNLSLEEYKNATKIK